jgi:gluconate 2-dehydrogenase gamma chain
MDDRHRVSRRRFMKLSSAAAVGGGLAAGCRGRFQPRTALSSDERALVEAIADQIVPPDQHAGGRDANVAGFIDTQLRGPYKRYERDYRDGLRNVEATSQRVHGRAFVALAFDEQTALLSTLERGKVPDGIWRKGEAPRFFQLICDHCLQGYYGSPRHGGNRRYASWKMLKLDYPQLAGRVLP